MSVYVWVIWMCAFGIAVACGYECGWHHGFDFGKRTAPKPLTTAEAIAAAKWTAAVCPKCQTQYPRALLPGVGSCCCVSLIPVSHDGQPAPFATIDELTRTTERAT